MRYLLAVDSGGSKCDALLTTMDGTVLGWGHVAGFQQHATRNTVGSGRAAVTVARAIYQAVGEYVCEEVDIAGLGGYFSFSQLSHIGVRDFRLHQVFEHDPVFALADVTYGVSALAGTGAVAFARLRDGRRVAFDGLGPLLGDHGGGHMIGLQALKAVARAGWHPRHTTLLSELVPPALGLDLSRRPLLSQLVDLMLSNPDRAVVASVARTVDEAARAGDAVARGILEQAADALAETVFDVTTHCDITTEAYPFLGLGSVASRSDLYWNRLCERVLAFAPRFTPQRFDLPPVVGMALCVLRQHAGDTLPAVRETLIRTARKAIAAPPPEPHKERDWFEEARRLR
jgi:N-acetylglucosamine kinase-like BadF-type ATPase